MTTLVFLMGAALLVAGFAWWWPPAGLIVAGVMVCATAVLLERGDDAERERAGGR